MGLDNTDSKKYLKSLSAIETMLKEEGLVTQLFELSNQKAKDYGWKEVEIPRGELLEKMIKAYSWQVRVGYAKKRLEGFNLIDVQNYLQTVILKSYLDENPEKKNPEKIEELKNSIYTDSFDAKFDQLINIRLIQPQFAEIGKLLYFMTKGYHNQDEKTNSEGKTGPEVRKELPLDVVPANYGTAMIVGNHRFLLARLQGINDNLPVRMNNSKAYGFSKFIKASFGWQQQYYPMQAIFYLHKTIEMHTDIMKNAPDKINFKNILNNTWVPEQ